MRLTTETCLAFSCFTNSSCSQPVESIAIGIILFLILQAQTVKEYSIDLTHLKAKKEKAEEVKQYYEIQLLSDNILLLNTRRL